MWKFIILSVMLSVVQGATLDDIYGNYTFVLMYTNNTIKEPPCGKITFSEQPRKSECNCSDGRDCASVIINLPDYEETIQPSIVNIKSVVRSEPVLIVDHFGDLPLMNITCSYANKIYEDQRVIEIVNKNYILGYYLTHATDKNNIKALLMARELPSASELEHDITHIDKLKGKVWTRLCSREIFDQLHPKNTTTA